MDFFSGLAQGAAGLPAEIGQLQQIKRDREAAALLANTYGSGGTPPAPQAPPPPSAALAALHRPQPTPQPAAPPQAMPRGLPARPAPAAPPPPAPQGPPPGAPTGQAGAEAPTGMAVDPALTDPVKESQSIIKNLWQTIKAKNPKADPLTMLHAVETQIDEIKGVAPITKAAMSGQIAMLRAQTDAQYKSTRIMQLWQKLQQDGDYKSFEEGMQDLKLKEQAREADQRATVTERGQDFSHEDRQASTAARIQVANIGAASRMSVAQLKEQGLNDRAIRALKGKHGATISSGLAKVLAVNPGADVNQTIETLGAAYGDDGTGGGSSPAPAAGGGGGVPANVQQYATSKGMKVVARQKDGWVLQDRKGNKYHLSGG